MIRYKLDSKEAEISAPKDLSRDIDNIASQIYYEEGSTDFTSELQNLSSNINDISSDNEDVNEYIRGLEDVVDQLGNTLQIIYDSCLYEEDSVSEDVVDIIDSCDLECVDRFCSISSILPDNGTALTQILKETDVRGRFKGDSFVVGNFVISLCLGGYRNEDFTVNTIQAPKIQYYPRYFHFIKDKSTTYRLEDYFENPCSPTDEELKFFELEFGEKFFTQLLSEGVTQ